MSNMITEAPDISARSEPRFSGENELVKARMFSRGAWTIFFRATAQMEKPKSRTPRAEARVPKT
jgi:hypothetical protein